MVHFFSCTKFSLPQCSPFFFIWWTPHVETAKAAPPSWSRANWGCWNLGRLLAPTYHWWWSGNALQGGKQTHSNPIRDLLSDVAVCQETPSETGSVASESLHCFFNGSLLWPMCVSLKAYYDHVLPPRATSDIWYFFSCKQSGTHNSQLWVIKKKMGCLIKNVAHSFAQKKRNYFQTLEVSKKWGPQMTTCKKWGPQKLQWIFIWGTYGDVHMGTIWGHF